MLFLSAFEDIVFYCVQSFLMLIFMLLNSSNDIFCPLVMLVVNIFLVVSKSFEDFEVRYRDQSF